MKVYIFGSFNFMGKSPFWGPRKTANFRKCPRMPAWHLSDSVLAWSNSIKSSENHCGTFHAGFPHIAAGLSIKQHLSALYKQNIST